MPLGASQSPNQRLVSPSRLISREHLQPRNGDHLRYPRDCQAGRTLGHCADDRAGPHATHPWHPRSELFYVATIEETRRWKIAIDGIPEDPGAGPHGLFYACENALADPVALTSELNGAEGLLGNGIFSFAPLYAYSVEHIVGRAPQTEGDRPKPRWSIVTTPCSNGPSASRTPVTYASRMRPVESRLAMTR